MAHFKTAWITGASTGIGEAVTTLLIEKGTRVGMTARNPDTLHRYLQGLDPSLRKRVLLLPADVRNIEQLAQAYENLQTTWGVPDLLLANAGTHINMPARRISWEDCHTVLDVNLLGGVRTITLVLPDMIARGSGHIAAVGSLSSYRGLPWAAAYGASKSGLNNFLQSLRFDVEPHGILVTAINPGFVKTPLTAKNPFPMPMSITAETAAKYICEGLGRNKMEIHFPPLFSWFFKMLRILPYPIYHQVVKRMTGSHKRKE